MIRILSPLAAPVCDTAGLSSQALDLVTPQQSPAEYVSALEKSSLQGDACKFMVYGMSERDAVCYATKSAQKVADPSNLVDQKAIQAAEAWMKVPGEASQKAATAAATAAGHASPGAWAAQAAAFAQVPPAGAAVPGAPNLTSHAAWGAIQLAATSPSARADALAQMAQARAEAEAKNLAAGANVPKVPEVPTLPQVQAPSIEVPAVPGTGEVAAALAKVQTARAYQPFSDIGKGIANGTCTC